MALSDEIKNDVQNIISTRMAGRVGRVVPISKNVRLAGDAVELSATFLYADLANSSKIAKTLDRRTAAKILKSFLATTSRLVRAKGGSIVSFDGDRILGVFVGNQKNTAAVECALNINYVVKEVIKPKFEAKYPAVKKASFSISHGTGIDTGEVLAVRAGARGSNDLIWIGRAPNLAAKLSDFRGSSHRSSITAAVYNQMLDSAKYSSSPKKNIWKKHNWKFLGQNIVIYRSADTRKP
jgi:adenylate cyclase